MEAFEIHTTVIVTVFFTIVVGIIIQDRKKSKERNEKNKQDFKDRGGK